MVVALLCAVVLVLLAVLKAEVGVVPDDPLSAVLMVLIEFFAVRAASAAACAAAANCACAGAVLVENATTPWIRSV